jgi:hypothetical protein
MTIGYYDLFGNAWGGKTSTPIGTRGREYKRGSTNPGSKRASEVGSIEALKYEEAFICF